jgi:glycosyltransferase involved in cell wall biosynthesis
LSRPADRPRYSVVVPVYRNEETLAAVVRRMTELADHLDGGLEVVFVVDGSPDGSLILLRRLLPETTAFSSQLTGLSRNFGSFSAIKVGLAAAEGDYVAVMAADLQEPLSLIEAFFAALSQGDSDVAIGARTTRSDPLPGRALSQAYWWLYRRFVRPDMPAGGVDVFACTRQVVDQVVRLEESHTSLIGLLFWLGYRRVEVPYERQPRSVGRGGWTLRRRLRYLLDSVFSFTDLPVMLLTLVGVVGVLASSAVAIVVLVAWLAGTIDVAGYTPLMLAVVFTASSTLLGLGVIGSYVWRTYENTKGRPGAVPMSHERFDPPGT